MVDEDHTFPKYNDARNKFLNASGTFQSIIFSKGLNTYLFPVADLSRSHTKDIVFIVVLLR